MKKVNRITSNEDFAKIIHSVKPLRSESFLVFSTKSEFNYGRVGISVSKKVCNAVFRNKCKRQIRAMCDDLLDYKTALRDVVIVVKSGFLEKSFHENKDTLKRLLEHKEKR